MKRRGKKEDPRVGVGWTEPEPHTGGQAPAAALRLPNLVTSDKPCPALGLTLSICTWGRQDLLQQRLSHAKPRVSAVLTGVLVLLAPGP